MFNVFRVIDSRLAALENNQSPHHRRFFHIKFINPEEQHTQQPVSADPYSLTELHELIHNTCDEIITSYMESIIEANNIKLQQLEDLIVDKEYKCDTPCEKVTPKVKIVSSGATVTPSEYIETPKSSGIEGAKGPEGYYAEGLCNSSKDPAVKVECKPKLSDLLKAGQEDVSKLTKLLTLALTDPAVSNAAKLRVLESTYEELVRMLTQPKA